LAKHCSMERYASGDQLFAEGEQVSDVLVLIRGAIELSYQMESTGSAEFDKSAKPHRLFVRRLSQPGHIVSWAALTQSRRQDISAVASEDSLVCCIPASAIADYSQSRTDFSINLYEKLLNIIGSRLRATRALLINQYTKSEQATVCSLLHNLGPQLSIESPLHKVPYLLENRATQEDSFHYIDRIQKEGSQFEKNVAGLCSDILRETRRECEFYKGLRSIYQMVVNSDRNLEPGVIRNKSAAEFAKLFSDIRYTIQGDENLPESAGHIFIMNHLISHPYHKLVNGFEFALDTHFLSSMILARKYEDSGIRVVRNSRAAEYGHEAYYKRLGHIHVYTDESPPVESDQGSTNWREKFFNQATSQLRQGKNIIICPEGTSYWGDQSPGVFKSGAFRLAAMQDSETLIVPVVVANFDKRLNEAILTAVIKPPFKIRGMVDPDDRSSMEVFLNDLRRQYKSFVEEARQISDSIVI
ncbi:MAG: cyclic nucleotide-binding domain-containing protein, partial [Gammaproteobacteria bacterium]